ncbi:Hpt domain-containing protein [Acidimangrovimonas sediminis]|uniref:Hpt domain-containing protein n=1 Tax=Acidimangrovimonas sediminis TaxID=2056283 RepID=UPI001304E1E6|nr:Hpt domain-containing protein [Acidimangrovimonas sediminis]
MGMVAPDAAQRAMEAKLQAMRPKFVAQVTQRLFALEDLRDMHEADPGDERIRAELIHGAHKLAGIAGMFGEPDLGELARVTENALGQHDPEALDRLDELLGEMAIIATEE